MFPTSHDGSRLFPSRSIGYHLCLRAKPGTPMAVAVLETAGAANQLFHRLLEDRTVIWIPNSILACFPNCEKEDGFFMCGLDEPQPGWNGILFWNHAAKTWEPGSEAEFQAHRVRIWEASGLEVVAEQ